MCQILLLTNTTKVKNQEKLINTVAAALQESQADGFGYAIVGKSGVFGERTNRDTFASRNGVLELVVDPKLTTKTYNNFGMQSPGIGGAVFHGRTSTNHKTLLNTHPLVKKDWTLIHNGVVTDLGPAYKKTTTNDTEDILQHLVNGGIRDVEKYISGYYAVGAIDPDGNLHVFKDSTARLYVAYVKTLDCHVFGTTEELIESVAGELKWTIGPIDVVRDNSYFIFNRAGELLSDETIKPLGWGSREAKYAESSLGRSLGSGVYDVSSTSEDYRFNDDGLLDTYGQDSESAYFAEIQDLDPSYTITSPEGFEISIPQFLSFSDVQKKSCRVIRPDGTLLDHTDYYTEKLA